MGEVSSYDIGRLERQVREIGSMVGDVNSNVLTVNTKLESVQSELKTLKDEFERMMVTQQRNAVIQKATTELVRVRQEIQSRFGNYDVVRKTMIGILQATDVALVKETTVSRVSEELMIATPEYWLAPCLVALAAWISNDRALAERAISESMRRDVKKTAITMALICRRNERTKTCFEWLDVYFQNVSPESVTEDDFAYVNAYASGVFGYDESHICDEYISMWVDKVTQNSEGLNETENTRWKEYCSRFKTDITVDYDALSKVPEFNKINDYVGRLEAVREVRNEFNMLNSAEINIEALRREVDSRLEELINNIETAEYELKDEELFYQKTKIDGDEEKARREIAEEKRRREEETLNIIEQMSNIVRNSDKQDDRRTALRFVNGFANRGMTEFVQEGTMPESVTVKQDGWEARINNQTDIDSVCRDYESKMLQDAYAEKERINAQSNVSSIVIAVICAVAGIALAGTWVGLTVIGLCVAAYFGYQAVMFNQNKMKKMNDVDMKYREMIEVGKSNIANTVAQYKQVCYRIYEIYNNQNNAA